MPLMISLPADVEIQLRERARIAGKDMTEYVRQLLVNALGAPLSLAEASEPLATAVDAAGVADEEFMTLIVEARDAARRDRRR